MCPGPWGVGTGRPAGTKRGIARPALGRCRSKAALTLNFEVCKGLQGHLELLPKTGCIQALSSYSVRLKFLPRCVAQRGPSTRGWGRL